MSGPLTDSIYKFEKNIKSIDQITEIGSDVSKITLDFLANLKKSYEGLSGFMQYKQKLDTVIEQVKTIKDNPVLKEKYGVIYNQALVIFVSGFESFLDEISIIIIDSYHEMIIWPQEDKKIAFEVGRFDYKLPTIGEITMGSLSKEINFQDLKSTKRYFNDYLGIDLKLESDLEQKIIKYQALRHVIIHSSSKVDEGYLRQVRNTKYSKTYTLGSPIKLTEADYHEVKAVFIGFFERVKISIKEKMILLYGKEFFEATEAF